MPQKQKLKKLICVSLIRVTPQDLSFNVPCLGRQITNHESTNI